MPESVMIENTLPECSDMKKTILVSCALHKIIPESPTTEQKTTGATKDESPSMRKPFRRIPRGRRSHWGVPRWSIP